MLYGDGGGAAAAAAEMLYIKLNYF